jgi:hypothetical protein
MSAVVVSNRMIAGPSKDRGAVEGHSRPQAATVDRGLRLLAELAPKQALDGKAGGACVCIALFEMLQAGLLNMRRPQHAVGDQLDAGLAKRRASPE